MDILLKRMTPTQEEPQSGPSGGIQKEGIDIIDSDSSSMHGIAPGDLPVRQDVQVEDSDMDNPDPVMAWANVLVV